MSLKNFDHVLPKWVNGSGMCLTVDIGKPWGLLVLDFIECFLRTYALGLSSASNCLFPLRKHQRFLLPHPDIVRLNPSK
jgi:hypothetical protein